jgi:ubiquinone/menaquinone biosynthesis C-methylase UbiE
MELTRLKENWETLAQRDPMWAILSNPSKKGRKWDPVAFFESGEAAINHLLGEATATGIPLRHDTALDFGCGLGRLTQALCSHFGKCYGVDISSNMLAEADRYNHFGTACEYVLNDSPDLHRFENDAFDFICAIIVLQHMPADVGKEYISEFVRVLKPGGLLVFQVPSTLRPMPEKSHGEQQPVKPTVAPNGSSAVATIQEVCSRLKAAVRCKAEDSGAPSETPENLERLIDMHGIPREEVVRVIEGARATLVQVQEDDCAGPEWFSFRYWVTKRITSFDSEGTVAT